MSEIQLAFDIVQASVHQVIQIKNESYDEDSIIQGLKDGKLATSTWICDEPTELIVIETGEVIGIIVSQEINGEYDDYR